MGKFGDVPDPEMCSLLLTPQEPNSDGQWPRHDSNLLSGSRAVNNGEVGESLMPLSKLECGLTDCCVIVIFFGFVCVVHAQQTTNTNTNCNTYGNTANCTSTSTTTDYSAQQAEQQRQAYETGQRIGAALGTAMQAHALSKNLRKYCDAHPGQDWHYYSRVDGHTISSGHCPSDEDKAEVAANEFAAHHKEFIRGPANAEAMVSYIQSHNLDPRERKSYERAFSDLKKAGQISLYSK